VLAAINKVETNFGQNLGPSSAGAVGWMQFMPSTWKRWGIDANGDGVADPNDPTDAIFSAAHYLAGCGGQFNISGAIYCYNHATWYVNEVLSLASMYGRGGGGGGNTLFAVDQFQPRIDSVQARIHTAHAQLADALAHARGLAHAQRPFLHKASSARLLSNQLEARKHAVQLGARRDAVEARVAQLRRVINSATKQLGRLRDQANAASLGSALLLTPLTSGAYGGVVSIAMQYLGVPYLWAGATPSGFDCSGLVQYAFAQIGISLPHNTVAQWNYPGAVSVPRNQLQPGDLVFFNKLDHVGIYIGNGQFIDAPHTGAFVRVDNLSGAWYTANYDGAKRIVGGSLGGVAQLGGATTAFTTSESTNTVSFTPETVYFTH
jgi:cell wall-associated NlpC family hydrolase